MDRLLTSPSGPPRRMAELDLLRCLAILMVVTLHAAAPLLSDPSLLGTPAWYFCLLLDPFSRTGVPLFFMLSGFLILRDSRTLQVGPFYRRRLPRLVVPLVLWNLIYALADSWGTHRPFSLLEYLGSLLDRGCYYHIWFIYLLVGLYLLAPLPETDRGPRQRARGAGPHWDHPAAHHPAPPAGGALPHPVAPSPPCGGPDGILPCWAGCWEASRPAPLCAL